MLFCWQIAVVFTYPLLTFGYLLLFPLLSCLKQTGIKYDSVRFTLAADALFHSISVSFFDTSLEFNRTAFLGHLENSQKIWPQFFLVVRLLAQLCQKRIPSLDSQRILLTFFNIFNSTKHPRFFTTKVIFQLCLSN